MLGVGVTARTKNYHKKMRKARADLRKWREAVKKESAGASAGWGLMGRKMTRTTRGIATGLNETSGSLLKFTDAATTAGKAASGMASVLQGALSAGISGAAFAGVNAIFSAFAESKRKAEQEATKAAEKRARREKQLADDSLAQARSLNDRILQMRKARAEGEWMAALSAREREAKAVGRYFDRQLQLELRASDQALKQKQRLLADEEAALASLRAARDRASGDNRRAMTQAIALRQQSIKLLREEVRAEKERPDASREASAMRARAKAAAEMREAQDRIHEKAMAAQKARSDARVAMRQAVEEAERLVNMTEEERRSAAQVAKIRQAEALGLKDVADRLRALLEYDQARAKHAKDLAAHQAKSQRGANVNKQLRQREKLARATGDAERFAVEQQGEYLRLLGEGADRAQILNTLAAERARWIREQKVHTNETVEGLRDQVALAKAATDEKRKEIQRQQELNDLRKRGGEEAVRLQEQLNKLADQAAQKAEQAAKRQARLSDPGMGNRLRGGLDEDGNFQGLGLAAARQARRDANRSRKRRRAQNARDRNVFSRSIHDGQFSGLGGIRSGRRIDQQGPASQWEGGGGDMPRGRGRRAGGGRGAGSHDVGDPQGAPGGPNAPGAQSRPTTSTGGAPADNRDEVNSLAEAEERHKKAVEELLGGLEKASESAQEGAEAATTSADKMDELLEASQEHAEAAKRQQESLDGLGAGLVETLRATADKTNSTTADVEQMKADLEAIRESLG